MTSPSEGLSIEDIKYSSLELVKHHQTLISVANPESSLYDEMSRSYAGRSSAAVDHSAHVGGLRLGSP